MENLAGYLASALIGVSLGLIGGGGSIITIPVLVYLFHIEPTIATAYSLFIVGTTSMVGGIRSSLHDLVDFRSAILFSIPSTLAVYLTRHFLLPHLPENMVEVGGYVLTKDVALMLFFAVIMVLAALRMIASKTTPETTAVIQRPLLIVILQGFVVGIITGIVGAGGGFLIIPALVLLIGLPMKKAVGTSLIIIAINSLVGFVGDIHVMHQIDFLLMLVLSALAVIGVFTGAWLSRYIDGKNLKTGFGWFALAMAIFIMVKELIV